MQVLGSGLSEAKHHEDALHVKEAQLSMMRRLGDSEDNILGVQGNLSNTYSRLGRLEEALQMDRDIYCGRLKLNGEEHVRTLIAANNYAASLLALLHFEEAKSLLSKATPVARRALGEDHIRTLKLRWSYAMALYEDPAATRDDFREAVTSLEELERTARRVFGGEHPTKQGIELSLQNARAALRSRTE